MAAARLRFQDKTASNEDTRLEIAQCLFGTSCRRETLPNFKQYFDYYDDQIDKLRHQVQFQDTWNAKTQAISTHGDMLKLWRALRQTGEVEKMSDKMSHLRNASSQPEQVGKEALIWATTVTLRLCLMVNIPDEGVEIPGQESPVQGWDKNKSIDNFLLNLLPAPKWDPTAAESRPDPNFTIAFMIDVCGLKIRWTDSLHEHLKFDRLERRLAVFSHMKYLSALQRHSEYVGKEKLGLWPKAIVDETVCTLLLLFPDEDTQTETILNRRRKADPSLLDCMLNPAEGVRWLFKKTFEKYDIEAERVMESARETIIDIHPTIHPESLGLGDFKIWRDRLLELRQEVYLAPPADWRQLFRDKRNPQQYWTFWLALFILILTLVSTGAGIISTVTGFISMRLAQAQAHAPQTTVFCEFNTSHARPLGGATLG